MKLDFKNIELKAAFDLIQETNKSFFLTGKAGTGKSTFLKQIVKTNLKNYVVVAPTGIAAVNVGGMTIHSFFQFPLRPLLPDDEDIKVFWKNSEKRKIIQAMDTLIIDEISMVRADLIDGIDYSLRRNGGNPNLAFGGKQVIFVGDIFQLEPITIKNSGELKIINEIYGSAYFYNAKVFEKVNLFTIELQKVYRQSDPKFINLLDKVRVKETLQSDIDKINSRVFSESKLNTVEFAITLTTTNDLADSVNSNRLSKLKTNPKRYIAEVSGEFEENKYPTEPELILKEGAQVIFIKNDTEKRWVNGTIGQVFELTNTVIKVRLPDSSIHSVEKRVWENIKYQYIKEKKKIEQEVVGTFKQYPLRLAWAITIHKSQGLTFDRVVIDFGVGTFASGQAYVALSRATTFEGLFLKQKVHSTDIYIDEEIKDFAKTFNDKSVINQNLIEGKELYKYRRSANYEEEGTFYFKKAIELLIKNQFNDAYENIVNGYTFLTCDCNRNWFKSEVEENLLAAEDFDCCAFKLDFLKAFIFFYSEQYEKALNSINSFIDSQPSNELGHYFKGKTLIGLKMFSDALISFKKALSIKKTAKTLYKIGRVKEQFLNEYGLDEMFQAIKINPSSVCAHWHFAEHALKRNLFDSGLKTIQDSYDKNEDVAFRFGYSIAMKFVKEGEKGINVYLNTIEKKLNQFTVSDIEDDENEYNDEENDHDDNYWDSYGSSYEKYGGYNGYDDDTIDDAFEGDPMNTWNVD